MLKLVIPQRDREVYLNKVLPVYEYMLRKTEHELIIVQQDNDRQYNLGKSINIGFDLLQCGPDDTFCYLPVDTIIAFGPRHFGQLLCRRGEIRFFTIYTPNVMAKQAENFMQNKGIGYIFFTSSTQAFEKIGGMTNRMQGWGCEDHLLTAKAIEHIPYNQIYFGDIPAVCLDEDGDCGNRTYGIKGGSYEVNNEILHNLKENKEVVDNNIHNKRKDYEITSKEIRSKTMLIKVDW